MTSSSRPQSTQDTTSIVYTKTLATFEPYLDTKEATQLAERIDTNIRKINEEKGSLILFTQMIDELYRAKQSVIYQEMIKNLHVLHDALIGMLSEYTVSPTEARFIAESVIAKIKAEDKPTQPFYKRDSDIAAQARKQLSDLSADKQMAFDIHFSRVFKQFEEGMKAQYENIDAELMDVMEKSLSEESLTAMEAEDKATENVKEKIDTFIQAKLEPAKPLYTRLYGLLEQGLASEAINQHVTQEECIDYMEKNLPGRIKPLNQMIERLINEAIADLLKSCPEEMQMISAPNLAEIKSEAMRDFLFYQSVSRMEAFFRGNANEQNKATDFSAVSSSQVAAKPVVDTEETSRELDNTTCSNDKLQLYVTQLVIIARSVRDVTTSVEKQTELSSIIDALQEKRDVSAPLTELMIKDAFKNMLLIALQHRQLNCLHVPLFSTTRSGNALKAELKKHEELIGFLDIQMIDEKKGLSYQDLRVHATGNQTVTGSFFRQHRQIPKMTQPFVYREVEEAQTDKPTLFKVGSSGY